MSFADTLSDLPKSEDFTKLNRLRLEREKEAVRKQVIRDIVGRDLEDQRKNKNRFSFLPNDIPIKNAKKNNLQSVESIDSEELNEQSCLIKDREQGINNISQDISFVHQIMQDLSHLTRQQGHLVDNIEQHIGKAEVNTERARTELVKAEKHQKKNRKLLYWSGLGGVGLVTTAAVLIGLGAKKLI